MHAGGSGFEAFERSRSNGLAEGWGWLVRRPPGGVHAYYPLGPARKQRSWQVPSAHADFRGDGGYVIAPPSRIRVGGRPIAYEVLAVKIRNLPSEVPRTVGAMAQIQQLMPCPP